MFSRSRRFYPALLILLVGWLAGITGVSAQEAYTATLSLPDTSQFPHLDAYLDVHDPTGAFMHGLSLQEVTLQENDLQVPASELQELKPGVQLVVAITPGESFSIRDSLGVSRYEYLLQGLLAGSWANQPRVGDDFSLITLGGPQLTHSADPADLRSALGAYLPADPPTAPSLEVLAAALQVAADPVARPGMERAILFITPPQEDEVSLGLQSMITSAIQQDIRIFVWLVAAQEAFELPAIDLLRNLASQTHAGFFAYSHDEPVPDLESILEPLRYVYQLGYESQVTRPGVQQVTAHVSAGSEVIISEAASFEVNLQAPVLTLLNIPIEIVRSFPIQPTDGTLDTNADLIPASQEITVRVSFPDGHHRSLTRTSLYVDGQVAAENTSAPFDRLVWDLGPFTQDGEHSVWVEAIDDLGMSGKSAEISIRITLPTTTQGVLVAFSHNRPLLIGVSVLIAASMLFLLLILGGRIRPKPLPGQVKQPSRFGGKRRPMALAERPDRQPGQPPASTATPGSTQTRHPWRRLGAWLAWLKPRPEPAPAQAHLVQLPGSDEITLPAPIPVHTDEVCLGSDPQHADIVIADPSIEGLHARLNHDGQSFHLTDAGSVAGTWVNYNLIPPEGIRLEHADIIHLGRVGFRFVLTAPDRLRKIVVIPREPPQ